MINYNAEFKDIVNDLFSAVYPCMVNLKSLSLIIEDSVPVEDICNVYSRFNNKTVSFNTAVIERVEYSPNIERIISVFGGTPTITNDMIERGEEFTLNKVKHYLELTKIAEIVYLGGVVDLVAVEDSIEMYELINTYLIVSEERSKFNPHYNPPPEDDIAAFTKLRDMLELFAKRYTNQGDGNSAISELIAMAIKGTSVSFTEKEISLNGVSGLANIK